MAAFFGGQYYFAFDSSRQYVLQYYGPRSRIDFDGHTAQGLEAIGFVYNAEFLIGVTHHVTEISSSVEPITNQRILTFRGIIRMGGQLRDFHEIFITEGQLLRNGQIVQSTFRSVPRQAAALYQPQALMDHSQIAAFFGGQYYFIFDSSRPYLLRYYDSTSMVDFDGQVAQGLEGISFVYNANSLIGVTHLVTEMSSFVEPITNRRIITFSGIIRMRGQLRDFHEIFITEGQLIPRNGRIVHNIFRSAPRQQALPIPMQDVAVLPASQGFSADPVSADEANVVASSQGSNAPDAADVAASSHGSMSIDG
ncbi:hypothetical protein ACJRO7_032996 [Eucalyptus globulus]|uniref:NTF2 domain-containing protein n=1 Tax=Eucalyptus globulus TaxID=34317 RepID=A0ABD3JL72_EUCGL